MRNFLNLLLISVLSFALSSCDGLQVDGDSNFTSSDENFSLAQLSFNVIYSDSLLTNSDFNNPDGFIVLFKDIDQLDQIQLGDSGNDDALVGMYPWEIDDGDLVVTYPNGAICTSSQTSETTTEIEATSTCSGGEPENDRIQNTLNIPNSFDDEDLEGRSVFIDNEEGNDQRIEFLNNPERSFQIIDINSDGDEITTSIEMGTYADSGILNNVVTLSNNNTGSVTRLILLDGGLSQGTLLSLEYADNNFSTLLEVRILEINENNVWEVDSIYDDIDVDQ